FFSSRRRHTRFSRDWSSDVCSSDLQLILDVICLKGIAKISVYAVYFVFSHIKGLVRIICIRSHPIDKVLDAPVKIARVGNKTVALELNRALRLPSIFGKQNRVAEISRSLVLVKLLKIRDKCDRKWVW